MKSEGDSEQVAHSPSTATTSQLCALFSLHSLLATTHTIIVIIISRIPIIPLYVHSIVLFLHSGKKNKRED